MSKQRILALSAIALSLVITLVAFWKWALFGLDADVGMACAVTVFLFGAGGAIGLIE